MINTNLDGIPQEMFMNNGYKCLVAIDTYIVALAYHSLVTFVVF
jgi:hypothetical protein